MSTPVLSSAEFAQLLDNQRRGLPNKPLAQVPVFINGDGPFLVRDYPARLLRLPMRTAYALLRAHFSPRITWPPYTPTQDWVVRASANAYTYGSYAS